MLEVHNFTSKKYSDILYKLTIPWPSSVYCLLSNVYRASNYA